MQFTRDDFEKIVRYLNRHSARDSEFPCASPLKGCETVAILQDGVNKKMTIRDFSSNLKDMDIPDFYNVSSRHNVYNLSLQEALKYVPVNQRKLGMVVTFKANDNWYTVQFKGDSVNQWDSLNLWKELFEVYIEEHIVHPDEEDITGVQDNNRKFLKFKDRKYKPEDFSGKGRRILRKNLIGTEACSLDDEDHYDNILTQESFPESNTVYIIRYDYTLNGFIRMPDNCELVFEGGTITGGIIDLNECKLSGMIGQESDYFINVEVLNWSVGQIEYRDKDIKYWNGKSWASVSLSTFDDSELKSLINNYYSETMKEINSVRKEVTNSIENFNKTITELKEDISNINNDVKNINNRINNITIEQIGISAITDSRLNELLT